MSQNYPNWKILILLRNLDFLGEILFFFAEVFKINLVAICLPFSVKLFQQTSPGDIEILAVLFSLESD